MDQLFDAVILQQHPRLAEVSPGSGNWIVPELSPSGALILVDLRGPGGSREDGSRRPIWEHLDHPQIKRFVPAVGASNWPEWREEALRLGKDRELPILGVVIVAGPGILVEHIRNWALWGRTAGFMLIAGVNLPDFGDSGDDAGRLFDFSYQAEGRGLIYLPEMLIRPGGVIGVDFTDLRNVWNGRSGKVLPVASHANGLVDDLANALSDGREIWASTLSCLGSTSLVDVDEAFCVVRENLPGGDNIWIYWYDETVNDPEYQLCIIY